MQLLKQNYLKFTSYGYRAGIYSASANKKFIDKITFATIGSVKGKAYLFQDVKHIIIDECHLVNSGFEEVEGVKRGGMYYDFIHAIPDAKVLGLTATPYRLGAGWPDGAMLKFITRTRPKIFSKVIYGFDYPELECILMARSTMSLALYYQMVGRAMRPHSNKVSAWIVDLGGNYNFFGKIETMEIRECDKGLHSIWQGERQLTNVSFQKK